MERGTRPGEANSLGSFSAFILGSDKDKPPWWGDAVLPTPKSLLLTGMEQGRWQQPQGHAGTLVEPIPCFHWCIHTLPTLLPPQ